MCSCSMDSLLRHIVSLLGVGTAPIHPALGGACDGAGNIGDNGSHMRWIDECRALSSYLSHHPFDRRLRDAFDRSEHAALNFAWVVERLGGSAFDETS